MTQQLVLITGVTGHLGFKTLVVALQSGYRVRATLRKLEQADTIKGKPSIQPYLNAIEFVQVPDITIAGAYDEAIKGVDYVLHLASPIPQHVRYTNVYFKLILCFATSSARAYNLSIIKLESCSTDTLANLVVVDFRCLKARAFERRYTTLPRRVQSACCPRLRAKQA